MEKLAEFEKGSIIYVTNILDNKELIDYESFISVGDNKYIETWYFGMIINKNYIIDAHLKPRKIYKTKDTKITKMGEIDSNIIDIFDKMNNDYLNRNKASNNYQNQSMSFDNVKDLSDAPIEDSLTPEEVWYYIKEDLEEYNNLNIGEIVFVKEFFYLNGIIGKDHLFVITDKSKVSSFQYYGMLISSQIQKAKYKYNYMINKDDKNKLIKDSIVKTDVLYKLKDENIVRHIGVIDKSTLQKLKKMNKERSNEKY